jgi:DNA polymerase III epsilon subunit-like protein
LENCSPPIKDIFSIPLVAHSQFDKQVLNALSSHFNLPLAFHYTDSCLIAKNKLPNLKNCKLKTLVRHFGLPAFKHHDAKEDAIACAQIFLKLIGGVAETVLADATNGIAEFQGMLKGILADNDVDYKEACELLYWLEDHPIIRNENENIFSKLKEVLADNELDSIEAADLKPIFSKALEEVR